MGCLIRHRANFINSAAMSMQLFEIQLKIRFFGHNSPVMLSIIHRMINFQVFNIAITMYCTSLFLHVGQYNRKVVVSG